MLILVLGTSFFVSPVNAGVDIDVYLEEGNANVTLQQVNGTANVIVNNVDVIEEWQQAQQEASSYLQMIYYLQARSDVDDLENELDSLENDLIELVNQLNVILPAMENRDVMTLKVIGVDHNSSRVVTNLRSMNMSIADYLEIHEYAIDEYYENFLDIRAELDSVGSRIETIENRIDQNTRDINRLDEDLEENTINLRKSISELHEDTYGKFVMLGSLSLGTIVILLVQVYIQGVEYMRLKTKIEELKNLEN